MANFDRREDKDLTRLNQGLLQSLQKSGRVTLDEEAIARSEQEYKAEAVRQAEADRREARRNARKGVRPAAEEASRGVREAEQEQREVRHTTRATRPVADTEAQPKRRAARPAADIAADTAVTAVTADNVDDVDQSLQAVRSASARRSTRPAVVAAAAEATDGARAATRAEAGEAATPASETSHAVRKASADQASGDGAFVSRYHNKNASDGTTHHSRYEDKEVGSRSGRNPEKPNRTSESSRSRTSESRSNRATESRSTRTSVTKSTPQSTRKSERTSSLRYNSDGSYRKPHGGAGKVLGIILAVILGIVIVLGAAIFIIFRSMYGKANYVADSTVEMHLEEAESELELDSEPENFDVEKVVPVKKEQTEETKSILLIGSDRRDSSWYGNSDTMVLMTINYKVKKVFLVSFMRDLYADIPGVGIRKLNNAYAVGGGPLLKETLESNYGVKIDGYASVDFGKMQLVIDMVGGVDVEIDEAEAKYMNAGGANVSAGMNHLDGERAVAYSRIRYVGNSDWERTARQREVLMSIVAQARNMSTTDVMSLTTNILPLVTHNMSATEVSSLMTKVPDLLQFEFVTDRVPFEGTYYIDHEILVPDLDVTVERLQKEIYADQ